MGAYENLLFWKHKRAEDNEWHPQLGFKKVDLSAPSWLQPIQRIDGGAAVVDAAPLVVGAGALAYIKQLPQIGMTVPASLFKNKATLYTLAISSNLACSLIFIAQAAGFEYRYYLPRWASDRERRRDELEARYHVHGGIVLGMASVFSRNVLRLGPVYTRYCVLDVVLGGAIGDMLLREYHRAHNH